MRINVKAKPGAREDKVEKIDELNFVISVKEPPMRGRANKAIVKLLAEYFNVSASSVRIVSGYTSPQKIVDIFTYGKN